jgi:hypothetical protein
LLRQVDSVGALEAAHRAAAGDADIREVAEPRGDLLTDSPREVDVGRIEREVGEGEDRYFVRYRAGCRARLGTIPTGPGAIRYPPGTDPGGRHGGGDRQRHRAPR